SNEDAKEVVDTCIKTSDDLMKLFEDLMQWGKSKIGQSVINKTMNNIHDIVEQVKGQIDINLKQKNIELINIIPDSRLLLVDPDIMKTVFRNLISNAMKFSYPGGRIVVRENGDRELNGFPAVEFEVEDFGTGMKPEKWQKLFQLGVKVSDLGTHNEQGTGLGLILCKEFIERHGGTISVESEFGKGTKFKIVLPN
ncbi:MAG: HAMP domain-containing sensor histidine kinase, partial [Candidatus Kapabacteria bacterium]|nr:HAMP domain-containing sensor histidine kinase [Candidatus Kapabacteria bacterium]